MKEHLNLECNLDKMPLKAKKEHIAAEEMHQQAKEYDKLPEEEKIGRMEKLWLAEKTDINILRFEPWVIETIKEGEEELEGVDILDFIKQHPSTAMFFWLVFDRKTNIFWDCGFCIDDGKARFRYMSLFLERERKKFLELKLTQK